MKRAVETILLKIIEIIESIIKIINNNNGGLNDFQVNQKDKKLTESKNKNILYEDSEQGRLFRLNWLNSLNQYWASTFKLPTKCTKRFGTIINTYTDSIFDDTGFENKQFDVLMDDDKIVIATLKSLTQEKFSNSIPCRGEEVMLKHYFYSSNGFDESTEKIEIITDNYLLFTITNLKEVKMTLNDEIDLISLSVLTELKKLKLSSNFTMNLAPLQNLNNLESLILELNNCSGGLVMYDDYVKEQDKSYALDITGIKNLLNLKTLKLKGYDIINLISIKNLKNLNELDLSGIPYAGVNAYEGTYLEFWNNQITDLAPLENLTDLIYLNLEFHRITDLKPIKGLKNIEELVLASNNLSEISILSNLTNLRSLNIMKNNIMDISPLEKLKKLTSLNVDSHEKMSFKSLKLLKELNSITKPI